MNDRIRELRNTLGLSQASFGEKIGLKSSGVSLIESGSRSISDRHILLICNAFGVSETWLRTGIGEMFSRSDQSVMDMVASKYPHDSLLRAFLSVYVTLSDADRAVLDRMAYQIAQQSIDSGGAAATLDLDDAAKVGREALPPEPATPPYLDESNA